MKDLEKIVTEIDQLIEDGKIDKDELLTQLINDKLNSHQDIAATPIKQLMAVNMKKIITPKEHEHVISFGLRDINEELEGLFSSELTVVGGRPGMGKTQFLVSTAYSISKSTPVLFFSLQHNKELIVNRFIACGSGLPVFRLTSKRLEGKYMTYFLATERELTKSQLFISDCYVNNVHTFIAYCKKMIAEHGIKVVMIDGFENMNFNKYANHNKNRDYELSAVLTELKQFTNEANISTIISTELDGNTIIYEAPDLTDIRSCSLTEHLADKVMLLYRPDYYDIKEDDNGIAFPKNLVIIHVVKNNYGKCCKINIKRDNYFTRFLNLNDNTDFYVNSIDEMF